MPHLQINPGAPSSRAVSSRAKVGLARSAIPTSSSLPPPSSRESSSPPSCWLAASPLPSSRMASSPRLLDRSLLRRSLPLAHPRCRRRGNPGQLLRMALQQLLQLPNQHRRLHRLHQHAVRAHLHPVVLLHRKRRQKRHRRVVRCRARRLNHLATRRIRLHPHVRNHHLVFACTNLRSALVRRRSRIHIKARDFEHGLHRQQHGHFIVHQQDTAFRQVKPPRPTAFRSGLIRHSKLGCRYPPHILSYLDHGASWQHDRLVPNPRFMSYATVTPRPSRFLQRNTIYPVQIHRDSYIPITSACCRTDRCRCYT